tara:strand:+ start:19499 stop:20596 length:1098 start_codon:yes stop_codon:yes gene_type:complete
VKNLSLEKKIINELKIQSEYFINNDIYKKAVNNSKFSSIRKKDKIEIWSQWSSNIIRDLEQDPKILTNFRKTNYFITDVPGEMTLIKKFLYEICSILPKSISKLDPKICMLEDLFEFIKKKKILKLLINNSSPKTGSPQLYKKKNSYFTQRWIRHVWLLQLYNKFLKSKNIKIVLDIGSNYGALPYLLKKNDNNLKFILVDFPESLATAKYFLKKELPDTKIASFEDLKNFTNIDSNLLENYDFVLVPCFWIDKIKSDLVDLTINVASFNEMNRYWFNRYTNCDAYKTSKYIFLFNRFKRHAVEIGENPIDILDLNLSKFRKIFFDVSQLYKWDYTKREYIFGIPYKFKKEIQQPTYEFIGERDI